MSGRARRRDAPRLFARLCAAGACAYCSYQMCRTPLLPLFARELGAGPGLIGLIVGASTLTGIGVKLPAGALSDVIGRRRLLLVGACVFACLPFAYLLVAGVGALIATRLVHGGATAILGPVAAAAISDLAPADRRGRWLATYATIQGAGQAIGPILVGYLLASGGFWPAFVASGLLGSAALAWLTGWPPEEDRREGDSRLAGFTQGVREVAHDRRILATSLAQAGQFLLNGALGAFLPLFAWEVLGPDTVGIGWLVALQTAVVLVTRPAFGAVSDRLGRRPLIVSGLLICGGAVAALAGARDGLGLAVAVAAYGAGLAVTTSATSAYITDLTTRARYGAAHGVFGTIYDVGDAAGPIVAGLLIGRLGYRLTFAGLAGSAVAMAAVFAWVSRRWAGVQEPNS